MIGTTLVLGASEKPHRYAHMAVQRLAAAGYPVLAVGRRPGRIGAVPILTELPADARVDTVTLYLAPMNLEPWRARIMALGPRRVIFNPGTEDAAFARALRRQGIEAVEACTLVMLATGQY